MNGYVKITGLVTKLIGRVACFLVFLIMLITTSEVISRYIFNHPTPYAWPLNQQFFGLFILFAGSYTAMQGGHIRIEIVFERLPKRIKMLARFLGIGAVVLFLGTLIWQSAWMGLNSLGMNEKMVGAFRIPLYPFKLLIPLASFLFLCQVIATFLQDQFGLGEKSEVDPTSVLPKD